MCSAQTHKHIHTDHRDICSNRLHLLVALIVSRISYALSALGGFLTGQQINRTNVFFVKYDVLVFVPLNVLVMYRNVLASLIVNCSRVYKARPTACLTYFHPRRTSAVCVLEDMVTSFPYVSTVFVKKLFPDAYFIFFVIVNFSV